MIKTEEYQPVLEKHHQYIEEERAKRAEVQARMISILLAYPDGLPANTILNLVQTAVDRVWRNDDAVMSDFYNLIDQGRLVPGPDTRSGARTFKVRQD